MWTFNSQFMRVKMFFVVVNLLRIKFLYYSWLVNCGSRKQRVD